MTEIIEKLENNLVNITVRDIIYKLKAEELSKDFEEFMSNYKDAHKLLSLFETVPQFKVIATDSYFTHYSVVPLLRSTRNPDQLLEKVRESMKDYMNSRRYREIKILTTLNDELSKIYSLALIKSLIMRIRDELIRRNKGDLLDKLQQKMEELMDQQGIDAVTSGNYQPDAETQQIINQVVQEINNNVDVAGVFHDAVIDAKIATENAKEIEKLVGGNKAGKEAGTFNKLLKLTLETLWDVEFRTVINTAGKIADSMPQFVSITKERDKHGDELYGYRTTRKPWEALAKELALPDDVFEAKLISNGLLASEKVISKEGAYYVIIDKSGSMSGQKTVWARSVALAIFKLAQRKHRKFFLRFFDVNVYPSDAPITDPYDALDHILSINPDGGTSIDNALRTAVEDIKERKLSDYTNTVIIISDGEDTVFTPAEELKKNNIQLVAVMIKGHNNTLAELARKTGGKYLKAELDKEGALKVVEEVM